jgi:hypothetical protein
MGDESGAGAGAGAGACAGAGAGACAAPSHVAELLAMLAARDAERDALRAQLAASHSAHASTRAKRSAERAEDAARFRHAMHLYELYARRVKLDDCLQYVARAGHTRDAASALGACKDFWLNSVEMHWPSSRRATARTR